MAVPVIVSTTESSGSGTDTTVTMPETRPDGDIFVVVATKDDNVAWSNVPGAWGSSLFDRGVTFLHTVWVWKGSSEPESYTIEHDSEITEFTVLHITGGNADDIVEAFDSFIGTGDTATAPTVTPTNGNTLVLRTFGCDRDVFTSPPATNVVNVGGGGANDVSLAVSWEVGPVGGNPTGTASISLAGDEWGAGTICINESAGDTFEDSITLTADADVAHQRNVDVAAAMSLGLSTDMGEGTALSAESVAALAASAAIAHQGELIAEVLTTFGASVDISHLAGLVVENAITLDIQGDIATARTVLMEELITLNMEGEVSASGVLVALSLINLDNIVDMTASSIGSNLLGTVLLPINMGESHLGLLIAENAVALNMQGDIALLDSVSVEDAILLAVSKAISTQGTLVAQGAITIPVQVDIDTSGALVIPALITLGTQLDISVLASQVLENAITLAGQTDISVTSFITVEGTIILSAQPGMNMSAALEALSSFNLAASMAVLKSANVETTSSLLFSADMTSSFVSDKEVEGIMSLDVSSDISQIAQLIIPATITLPISAAEAVESALELDGSISFSVLASILTEFEPFDQIVRSILLSGRQQASVLIGREITKNLLARKIQATFVVKLVR